MAAPRLISWTRPRRAKKARRAWTIQTTCAALARVLDKQRSEPQRKRAIEIIENLASKNLANTEDLFFLASLEEAGGDWPKALKIYRELDVRTKNARDIDTLNRRPSFLTEFVKRLLRHYKPGDEQDLIDAQRFADELGRHQPDALESLALRVDVYRARKQLDQAAQLIETMARRPNLTPAGVRTLAVLAERIDRIDIAEPLYRQYFGLPNTPDGTLTFAQFLSRHGRLNDAIDLLDPIWSKAREAENIAVVASQVVSASNPPPDAAQLDRITRGLERAIKIMPDSSVLLVTLGNFREQQRRYDDAKDLYKRVIKKAPGPPPLPPNANLIRTMSYNNLAWLMALKDGDGASSLEDINHAIDLVGPKPDFLDTRGVIYLGMKQTGDAINDLEKAAKADPSPAKLFHLAQAYFQANNKEKAKQFVLEAKAKGLIASARARAAYIPSSSPPIRNCWANWARQRQASRPLILGHGDGGPCQCSRITALRYVPIVVGNSCRRAARLAPP